MRESGPGASGFKLNLCSVVGMTASGRRHLGPASMGRAYTCAPSPDPLEARRRTTVTHQVVQDVAGTSGHHQYSVADFDDLGI